MPNMRPAEERTHRNTLFDLPQGSPGRTGGVLRHVAVAVGVAAERPELGLHVGPVLQVFKDGLLHLLDQGLHQAGAPGGQLPLDILQRPNLRGRGRLVGTLNPIPYTSIR